MGLILVANPGSSSRKYALYKQGEFGVELAASLSVETSDNGLIGTLKLGDNDNKVVELSFTDVTESSVHAETIMRDNGAIEGEVAIDAIAVRVVAPGSYFMYDHLIDDEFMGKLTEAKALAPIHVANTLHELELLRQHHSDVKIVGISDSSFHKTKPSYAWNYGINIHHADEYDIKRFGYHGLSAQAAVDTLWGMGKLPPKIVACHLGSGSSITAVYHGRGLDTTMGYSPLEGVLMATRSGNIDPVAVKVLRNSLTLDEAQMEDYLNHQGGLLGLGGSADIRELIEREAAGDHLAHLALTTLVHTYHKAIGGMLAALGGADMLVFTGTVGERSAILRQRIVAHLGFADFTLDTSVNDACLSPQKPTFISRMGQSKPIIVIPTDEAHQIAKKATELI